MAQKMQRRQFLLNVSAGVLAAGWRAAGSGETPPVTPIPGLNSGSGGLIRKNLGKTGLNIPIVGMGVMNASVPEIVKEAYQTGVRLFDTSAEYERGQNEAMLGKALSDLNARRQSVLVTKVFVPMERRPMPAAKAKEFYLKTVEGSLRRLRTDYIDILLSHNVDSVEHLNNPGILEAFYELKESKKVRWIGFSTHKNMTSCIREATKNRVYDIIETAFNYAMADDADLIEALKAAAKGGAGLIAMKTQCSKYWYREFVPQEKLKFYNGRIIHTAVLKWALRHEFITAAIPGFTTFQQLEEDFSVARDLEYTPEEEKFLTDRDVKLAMSVCVQCGACLPRCPASVEIPTLMRTHMYAVCYRNFAAAQDALEEIPHGRGLVACKGCESCVAICAHRVNIPARILDLKLIYG